MRCEQRRAADRIAVAGPALRRGEAAASSAHVPAGHRLAPPTSAHGCRGWEDPGMSQPYTIVIGLEVHVQLLTQTKLFCRCSTKFGGPPNTQTCPICIGMPGTLPVMNREAFRLGLATAIALNCEIPEFTKWDRKQYYYPDLP